MNSKLFIADKIKVGFNPREDTYNGLLGYVIGFDGKKWRKETGWEGWRFKHITEEEYETQKFEYYNQRKANFIRNWEQAKKYEENDFKDCRGWNLETYKDMARKTQEAYVISSLGHYENNPAFDDEFKRVAQGRKLSFDERMIPQEFDNVPMEGFVLNKKVGGYSTGWNHRSTYCRVHDPRGFEFEITIPNLLFILEHCNSVKGKGLEGEFVYSWDGKDLVLLPACTQEYQSSAKFTALQSGKVSTKELILGGTYKTKSMEEYIYLGRYNFFKNTGNSWRANTKTCKKSHVFVSVSDNDVFMGATGLASFVQCVSDTPISNYAELNDAFFASNHWCDIDKLEEEELEIETDGSKASYFGEFAIKLADNQYKILTGGPRVVYEAGPTYFNRSYRHVIKGWNVSTYGIVTLKGNGEFTYKSVEEPDLREISYEEMKALNPIRLKTNKEDKNNGIKYITF